MKGIILLFVVCCLSFCAKSQLISSERKAVAPKSESATTNQKVTNEDNKVSNLKAQPASKNNATKQPAVKGNSKNAVTNRRRATTTTDK
jgi:hypothetical protein